MCVQTWNSWPTSRSSTHPPFSHYKGIQRVKGAQELDAVKMDVLLPEHLVQFLSSGRWLGHLMAKSARRHRGWSIRLRKMCVEQQLTASGNSRSTSSCAILRHLYRSKQVSSKLIYCLQGPTLSMLHSFWYRYLILIFTKAFFCLCSSQPFLND